MGYNSVADTIGLSSFVQPWLLPKVAKSREIPTKFDLVLDQRCWIPEMRRPWANHSCN